MSIIEKLRKQIPLIIILTLVALAVLAFGIFRQKILSGCAGTPCNELRNIQWEGILGPIIGVIGAYWVAKHTMILDQRHRAESANRPLIERINSVDIHIANALESFQHVKGALLSIADDIKNDANSETPLPFDALPADAEADLFAIEQNYLAQAEIALWETLEIYSERLSFEDKKTIWIAKESIASHRHLKRDIERLLRSARPASFTATQWHAEIAQNLELKCETFPSLLQRIKTNLKNVSDRIKGRI